MSVPAANRTIAPSSTGTAIKPVRTFFVASKYDPLTDTLMRIERRHGTLNRRASTIHERNLRRKYASWATHDLVSEASTIISDFLKWRAVADNFYMGQLEQHRRASDIPSGNGKHSNGNGGPSSGTEGGNGKQSSGSPNGNGAIEFIGDSLLRERRIEPKTTAQLVSQYTENIFAILDTLEMRGEFEAHKELMHKHGLQDGLILTVLEERALWP